MVMFDDFFGRLLPFKLGNIESGLLELPDTEPKPIHFRCDLIDGRVEAKFSIDDCDLVGDRLSFYQNLLTDQQSFMRVLDVQIPISIRNAPNLTFYSGQPPLVSNGTIRLNLDCIHLDGEIVDCSFVVSGLPRFHCPSGLRETGKLESWEYDYLDSSQPNRIRPLPSFECRDYRFNYILIDGALEPSQYQISFRRIDGGSMSIRDIEDMLGIWRRLLSFCTGVGRGAEIVLGYDREKMPVYGSWRRVMRLPRKRATWLPDGGAFDFRDFARKFIDRYLQEPDKHRRERDNELLDRYTRASSIIDYDVPYSLMSSYSILERLVKDKTGKKYPSRNDIESFLDNLGVRDEMRSNPLATWDIPRASGDELDNGTEKNRFGVRGMKTYRNKYIAHFDDVQGSIIDPWFGMRYWPCCMWSFTYCMK